MQLLFLQDFGECLIIVLVLLPQVWIQDIKRMTVVNCTHGLFLTFTQKSLYIYKSFIAIFTECTAFSS
jgi:hypothetical protein